MKRVITLMSFLACFLTCMAQDIIIKKDGRRMEGKVVEIGDTYVKYKKINNPDGPLYSIKVADLIKIEFEDGESEVFVHENLTLQPAPATVFPGMTGDIKDTELYNQYKDIQDRYKTPKKLRRIGLWGGCSFIGLGVIAMSVGGFDLHCELNRIWTTSGICLSSFGVAWGTTFYVIAYKKQKQLENMYELASSPLFRHDILITNNGKTLSLGVDYMSDGLKTRTLGLGMTFTF